MLAELALTIWSSELAKLHKIYDETKFLTVFKLNNVYYIYPTAASGHVSSDYKVQVARLAAHGNKPEEWKEYIDTVKSRVHLLEESKQKAMIEYMYFTAFKV